MDTKWEFTRDVLDSMNNLDDDAILDWIVWKLVCRSFSIERTKEKQKEYVLTKLHEEVDKWI